MAPVDVLFDLERVCPELSIDRDGHQFLATLARFPEELGVMPSKPVTTAVGRRAARGAWLAWHHDLGGDVSSFALSEGRLGEGVAIAGGAIAPLPFVDPAMAGPGEGLFVLSFAPNGALRFSRWIARGSSLLQPPRATAVVVGPHSEVTLVGRTEEVLDFSGTTLRPDQDAYDYTTAFIVQYTSDGTLAFATARPVMSDTSPRVIVRPDGSLVVGVVARDGRTTLEAFEPGDRGVGHPLPVRLLGKIGALAAAGPVDVVVATESHDDEGHMTRVARIGGKGEVVWSRTMRGSLTPGTLAVTTSGVTWFAGWFDAPPAGCVGAPLEEPANGLTSRLQLIDPSGAHCRSLPVSNHEARWDTPLSLLETKPGTMTFVTPFSGTTVLPGVHASADPLRPRCVAASLPTASAEYSP